MPRFSPDTLTEVGRPLSVCGEMAGDYATALLLLGMGYSGVSVAGNFLSQIKYAVSSSSMEEAQEMAAEILELELGEAVRGRLELVRVRLHDRLKRTSRRK